MFVTRCLFNYWLLATRLAQCLSQGVCSIIGYLPHGWHNVTTKFVIRFWLNYWLLVIRLPQRLSQGADSNIGYLSQGCHKVCHKVFVQLLVICHKVATIFTTRFGSIIGCLPQCLSQGFGPNWLFATRLSQCLSQSFGSIIGYLSQGYHTVCHNVLVQLLVTCHKVTTMFVTRFWFNYWLFDTQLSQYLWQDFGSIIGHLPQGCHNVCHKVLVQLLVICHKIATMFVTRFYV